MKRCRSETAVTAMRCPARHQGWTARRLFGATFLALVVVLAVSASADARRFKAPTYSSPIAMSANGKFVWSVNPGADTVSVIYTKTNKAIATVKVGDEPQSVALDPNNRYAFVA